MHLQVITFLMVVGLSCSALQGQNDSTACAALKTMQETGLKVISAEFEAAGPLALPSAAHSVAAPVLLPAHCAVRLTAATSPDSAVGIEVWLPERAAWNHKMLSTGNGGYSSALSLYQMGQGLRSGYATGGSDTGHQGDGLDFGKDHPEKIRDWAYRSTHVLAESEKKLIAAFYGEPARHSYFAGCSTGGQQGLSEAQRYPRDFDGIVAGDPGNDRILLNADFVASWLVTHPAGGAVFPAAKLPLLNKAAIAACDRNDGVADGVITEPDKCAFDPETLVCSASGDSSSCLTKAEAAMVNALYSGAVRDAAGKSLYPGWTRGSEAGWAAYLIAPTKPVRIEFWTDWIYADGGFDLRSFDAAKSVTAARAKLPFVEAVDPDLRAFQKAGGKLLMYHGWADPVVPPGDTIRYFEQVQKLLGSSTAGSVRLFMVPGMGHCSGGPGASSFDPLEALDSWVTSQMSPESIPASHVEAGKSTFSRPLCAFPKVARWDGRNDPALASSFVCREEQ